MFFLTKNGNRAENVLYYDYLELCPMNKYLKILISIIIVFGAITLAELFYLKKGAKQLSQPEPNIVSIKQETTSVDLTAPDTAPSADAPAEDAVSVPAPSSDPLPAKFLLPIPFYSQAPFGNWDKVHEEMCEESSVLNGGLYLLGEKPSNDVFEEDLMDFKKLEEKELGDYKSNTIAEVKKVADVYFSGKIKTKIVDNPTIEDIETEVAAGHPVVVPLAGRDIGNPNFTPPGPVYHMLIVKGYDAQNFITNDVGTRKGNSYTYLKEVIMKNMHDWNAKDIHLGSKRVLVLSK